VVAELSLDKRSCALEPSSKSAAEIFRLCGGGASVATAAQVVADLPSFLDLAANGSTCGFFDKEVVGVETVGGDLSAGVVENRRVASLAGLGAHR
jgi:hypothetical protein